MKPQLFQRIRGSFAARPWLVLLLLTSAPFVPGALQFLRLGVPDVLCFGDNATLEIRTLHASHGSQLMGPYSRFHWNHPGPAFFYLALPVYELFHERGPALNLFVLLCNWLVSVAIVWNARKLRGDLFALATALLLGLYETVGARFALSDDWNPLVPVLPLALLTLLSVRLALGCVEVLPWFLFVASAMVQTHVGYLPAALFLLGLAGLLGCSALVKRRLWQTQPRRVLLSVLIAALVLVFGWALPVYQNATGQPGNLSSLWTFFSAARQSEHGLRPAVEAVATELSVFPLALVGLFYDAAGGTGPAVRAVLALLETAGLAVGSLIAFRRRDRASAVFCVAVLGLILVGVASVRAIRGPIHDYLITWLTVVGMAAHAALASLFLPRTLDAARQRRARLALSALGVPLLLFSLWKAGDKPLFSPADPDLDKVAADVEAYLRTSQIERPVLRASGSGSWIRMMGLALALYKHRVSFAVADKWLFMVGPQFKSEGAPHGELAVTDRRLSKRDRRKSQLISASGNLFVYVTRR